MTTVTVWVLVVIGFGGLGNAPSNVAPMTIDNIASEQACHALDKQISDAALKHNLIADSYCMSVQKTR